MRLVHAILPHYTIAIKVLGMGVQHGIFFSAEKLVAYARVELAANALSRRCSTTELIGYIGCGRQIRTADAAGL